VSEPRPAAARAMSDLTLRTLAGLVMVAVALVAIVLGHVAFWVLACVGALFMMAEWSDLHGASPREKRIGQFALSVPLAIMAPPSLVLENRDFFVAGLLAGAAFFTVIVTRRPALARGVLYCGVPVLALTLIRRQEEGVVYLLWTLALVWACDIGAFFAGRTFGGPRLAPSISPAKTWSGLAGGVVLATLFGAAMHWRYGLPLRMTVATPALAVLAQLGDLYESRLKRRAGVKDSGNILPGHGGVMDRLDGVVPVAPVAALLVVLPRLLP
jgi:phosphatidate cytidylyltransferase